LCVEPASQLTEPLREYLKANKAELLEAGDAVMIFTNPEHMPSSLEELIVWLQDQHLAVLRDDRDFIKEILPMASEERDSIMTEYAQAWVQAMKGEPAIRRQNAGRFAANQFLMAFNEERSQTPGRQWYRR
tara:strand:+ start:989 stop:1381 length:393 start_codon:yes stop_codon:yes gene_type:complete